MNDATLGVLLQMQDTATPQIRAFGQELKGVGIQAEQTGPRVTAPMTSITDTMARNRMAMREMAMGVMFLGSTFVMLGASMRSSNNETTKNIGNVIMMAGALMTAVGSAFQFISAISKIIDALKKLSTAQILTQAFAGPAGWATLAIGGAVAAGAVYGISRYESAQTKATKAETAQAGTTVNQYIAGSVVTQRELIDDTHRGLLIKGQRSYTTGIK